MEDCPFKESFVSQKYEVVYSYGRGSRKKLYGDATASGPDYGGVAGGRYLQSTEAARHTA